MVSLNLSEHGFKYGKIQNTAFTPGKELDILIWNAFLGYRIQKF